MTEALEGPVTTAPPRKLADADTGRSARTDIDVASLRRGAVRVLIGNWRGIYTVPSGALYTHQWSWDSALIALGLAGWADRRAMTELTALLGAQWPDGRIPHIVFDSTVPADGYFPGPQFWRPARLRHSPALITSGIVQPPVHARAAWQIYRRAHDREQAEAFLHRLYPRLCAWHEYLTQRRDLDRSGLAAIVHPWESGMDNSPAWDEPLRRVLELNPAAARETISTSRRDLNHVDATERPRDLDYAAYMALATPYRDSGYSDTEDLARAGFAVEDPAFNALLAWSDEALAHIAGVVGADPQSHLDQAAARTETMVERLFDPQEGLFLARDLHTGRSLPAATVAGLIPLVMSGLPPSIITALVDRLTGTGFRPRGTGEWLLPSCDRNAAEFEPRRYWRGPAWVSTTWLVCQGLRRHARDDLAGELSDSLLRAVSRHGFREYFDPITGTGCGAHDFGWTASLVLDLIRPTSSRDAWRTHAH